MLIKALILLLPLSLLTGCETGANFGTIAEGSDSGDGSGAPSDVTFSGIDSVSMVTDSTATINWTHVVGGVQYQIFSVSGSTLTLIDSVASPTATLTPNTNRDGSSTVTLTVSPVNSQ